MFLKNKCSKKIIFVFFAIIFMAVKTPVYIYAYAENENGYPMSYDPNAYGNNSGNESGGSSETGSKFNESAINVETDPRFKAPDNNNNSGNESEGSSDSGNTSGDSDSQGSEDTGTGSDSQNGGNTGNNNSGNSNTGSSSSGSSSSGSSTTPQVDPEEIKLKNEITQLKEEVSDLEKADDKMPAPPSSDTESETYLPEAAAIESETRKTAENVTSRTEKVLEENISAEQKQYSDIIGDPVSVTLGEYILSDSDVKNVTRTYTSMNVITGSFGYGWYSNLDEVILVGSDQYSENPKTLYDENCVQVILNLISELKSKIISEYGVSSVENGKSELMSAKTQIENHQTELKAKKKTADSLVTQTGTRSISSKAKELQKKLRDLISANNEKIEHYEMQINKFENDVNILAELNSLYQEAIEKSAKYDNQYKENLSFESKNKLAKKNGMSAYYYQVGIGKLVYVDETGIPHVFEKDGSKYIPCSNTQHDLISIDVIDNNYRLFFKDGQKKIFDSNGLIVQIIDRNNNTISINRKQDGKVESIKTSFGENYNFTYDGEFISKIVKERNPSFKIEYRYLKNQSSGKTFLSSVIDEEGDAVGFEYTSNGKLTAVSKSDGSKIKITYNATLSDGTILATSTTNEQGFSENFEYNKIAKKTVYTDHDGNRTEYLYDSNHRTVYQNAPDGSEIYFTYDTNGNCISKTTNGDKIWYTYDSGGNITRADYSDGSYETWSYDKYSLPISHRDRDGVTETFERDSKGNETKYIRGGKTVCVAGYDSKGLMTHQTVYGGQEIKISYVYDNYGNLVEKTVGDRKEKYSYDNDDRLTKFAINDKVISTYEYENKKITEIDYNGKKTVYKTNNRKDLIQLDEIDTKTGNQRTTKFEYDKRHLPVKKYIGNASAQNLIFESRYTPSGLIEAERILDTEESYIIVYSYSGGEISKVTRFKTKSEILNFQNANLTALQNSASDVYTQKYEKQIESNGGTVFKITDEIGRVQVFKYDSFGNNIEYQNQLLEKFTNNYSPEGKALSIQSAYGGFYDFQYNLQGNMIGAGERNNVKSTVIYNNDGSILSTANCYGEKTVYSYNEYGQVSCVSSPGRTEWYSYDSFGRIARFILGSENRIETSERYVLYNYADDGRSVTVSEGGLYETKYDLNAFGEIVKRTDGNGNTVEFKYDENGNQISVTDGYGNRASFEYNCFGQITKLVDFDGSVKSYFYDSALNLVKQTDELGIIWQGKYDNGGRLISEKARPGIDKSYEYDNLDRLICVKTGGVVTESYSYSKYGREITFTDGNEKSYHYEMDEFGRLVGETNRIGGRQSYSYDAEGELKSKVDFNGNETKIEYKNGSKIVTRRFYDNSSSVIIYDMSGNILSAVNDGAKTAYQYNKAGKLIVSVDETGGDVLRYEYDSAGNRIRMTSNSTDTVYTYGKNNEVLSVYDNKQKVSVRFSYDKCGRETSRTFGNGGVQYTSYDKAGRVVLITEKNASGRLVRAEGYVYDEKGRQSAKVNESGRVTLYEYDDMSRVSKVYYPLYKELENLQAEEAEQNGLSVNDVIAGENKYLSSGVYDGLNLLLSKIGGSVYSVVPLQVFNVETYKYDKCNNLVEKTTPYGTIEYKYDFENRLVSSGAKGYGQTLKYEYDDNGNLLSAKSALKKSEYSYNAEDRMSYSQITDERKRTISQIHYEYDSFGRRILSQDSASAASRTMYDGLSFDTIKIAPVHPNGRYTDYEVEGRQYQSGEFVQESETDRYFHISDDDAGGRGSRIGDSGAGYNFVSEFDGAERVYILFGGTPVAVSQLSDGIASSRGVSYYGTDSQGSVRSQTDWYGELKECYSYDVMGSCVCDGAMPEFGYCGKRQGKLTGLLDYGYRDYAPSVGRFTTVDPVRDGVNWFGYCGGDAVNWVDLWGLKVNYVNDKYTMQDARWGDEVLTGETGEKKKLSEVGCAVTLVSNIDAANGGRNTPSDINKKYVSNGNIDWYAYAKDNNMQANRVKTALTKEEYDKMVNDSQQHTVGVLVESGYGGHWVGVKSMVTLNGKDYYLITGTSDNDLDFYYKYDSSENKNKRNNKGWIQKDKNSVLVPVDQCSGYIDFVKDIKKTK